MPTSYLALLALALLGVGGPLVLVGLAGAVGTLALLGIAAIWLGLLLSTATVLQVLRIDHQMARSRGKRLAKLEKRVEKLAELDASIVSSLADHQHEVLRTVDARILGLYENLREAGRDTGERPDRGSAT
jgi:membrane protein implicated in regulation of membrane protease activity